MPVYKDKNAKKNPWYYVIEVGEPGKRERIKKRGFAKERDARTAMNAAQVEHDQGINIKDGNVKLEKYLESWIKKKKMNLKARTIENYQSIIDNHINPSLGHLALNKIKPSKIEEMYVELSEKGLKNSTIELVHNLLSEALTKAHTWGAISTNPAKMIERPKSDKRTPLIWSLEECNAFLQVANKSRFRLAYILALTTGMRQGEILGLEWKDIDLEKLTITVKQILSHDGKEIEDRTKSDAGERNIAIPVELVGEIERHRNKQNVEKMRNRLIYDDKGLVMATKIGTPTRPRGLMQAHYNLLEKADVPRVTFHELRHTHASLMLAQNAHMKVVQERLGHSSIVITMDKYSHLTPNIQREAADKFGKVFFLNAKTDEV